MVSDAVLLKYAKTKMIMKDTPNVKNAKKFSELTPTKQKLARSSYQKDIMKKSKNITRDPPSAKKKYGHTEGTFLLGAPPSKKRIETGKGNPGKVVKEKTSLYLLSGDGIYKPGTYNLKKFFKDQGMKALKKKTEAFKFLLKLLFKEAVFFSEKLFKKKWPAKESNLNLIKKLKQRL